MCFLRVVLRVSMRMGIVSVRITVSRTNVSVSGMNMSGVNMPGVARVRVRGVPVMSGVPRMSSRIMPFVAVT
jgi:hypothetical protein